MRREILDYLYTDTGFSRVWDDLEAEEMNTVETCVESIIEETVTPGKEPGIKLIFHPGKKTKERLTLTRKTGFYASLKEDGSQQEENNYGSIGL